MSIFFLREGLRVHWFHWSDPSVFKNGRELDLNEQVARMAKREEQQNDHWRPHHHLQR